jgi:hypothetical protein
MSERENLFQPIHKGIRSMLYELGSRAQTTDFGDVNDSNRFVRRLKHDLGDALSNCILCLLRTHSSHEEKDIFAQVRRQDPDVIDIAMREHAEVARRIREVGKTCDDLLELSSPARRIEVGDRLNLEMNELFAFYLKHLNNEDSMLVPIMWERFTDEELRAMRNRFYGSLPVPLFETWLRWTLPSMNKHELLVLFAGLKTDPNGSRFKDWARLAHETLDLPRLQALEDQVGLGTS